MILILSNHAQSFMHTIFTFPGVVEHVLGRLKAKGAKPDAVRTYVQTVAQLR